MISSSPCPCGSTRRKIRLWAATQPVSSRRSGPARCGRSSCGNCPTRTNRTSGCWNSEDGSPLPDRNLLVELVRSGLAVAAHERNEKARLRGRPEPVDMQELAGVLAEFSPDHLRSTTRHLRIGPQHPLPGEAYRVLPNLIASQLIQKDWTVEHIGWHQESADGPRTVKKYGVSAWRRVATEHGAERISWPPRVCPSVNGTEYLWSYTLRLTLQNHALSPEQHALIHTRVGTRRWARSNAWDGQRGITAYLFTPSPWANNASPFGRAQMKWQPGPKGKREGKMVWNDVLAATMARFTSHTFLPSAPALAANPSDFLKPDGSVRLAGVVFRDGLGDHSHHIVGTGHRPATAGRSSDSSPPDSRTSPRPTTPFSAPPSQSDPGPPPTTCC